MMFAPNALSPSPGRTRFANPSQSFGRSSIAAPRASVSRFCSSATGTSLELGLAAADACRAGLLAGARVAVQRAALDGLVDQADERAVLRVGGRVVAALDSCLETVEVRL